MKRKKKPEKKDLFDRINRWLDSRKATIFYIFLGFLAIFSALLFDLRVSEGGDDSTYIYNAKAFLEGKSFPSHLGSFYPIFLSFFVGIFGVKLGILKSLSYFLILGSYVYFYKAFKGKIAAFYLITALIFYALSNELLYFASQTYSEAMFLFLQSLSFYAFFSFLDKTDEGRNIKLKKEFIGPLLFLGCMLWLMGITRMIGYGFLLSVLIYLIWKKRFIGSLAVFLSFLAFQIPYTLYKLIFWGSSSSSRVGMVLQKNPYNPTLGNEDFSGMIQRVIDNSNIYLSRHVPTILGWRESGVTENMPVLTVLFVLLLGIGFIYSLRKQNLYFFIGIYLLVMIGGSFVTLQQIWGQIRLILVYVPLILIFFGYGLIELSKTKNNFKILQLLIIVFVIMTGGRIFVKTTEQAKKNQKILTQNLKGNRYYGYTPDWQNFLAMSEWVSKNLPDSVGVMSRKSSMSFIYGNGREFVPIFRFPVYEPEPIINKINSQTTSSAIINTSDLRSRNIPVQVQMGLARYGDAYLYGDSKMIGLYDLSAPDMASVPDYLKEQGVPFQTSTDSILNVVKSGSETFSAVVPDSLLNNMRDNGTDYVIRGNLRVIPSRKTERTINTISRYVYFVELKYPGIFEKVHQIGADEDEPAILYRVRYDRYPQ